MMLLIESEYKGEGRFGRSMALLKSIYVRQNSNIILLRNNTQQTKRLPIAIVLCSRTMKKSDKGQMSIYFLSTPWISS